MTLAGERKSTKRRESSSPLCAARAAGGSARRAAYAAGSRALMSESSSRFGSIRPAGGAAARQHGQRSAPSISERRRHTWQKLCPQQSVTGLTSSWRQVGQSSAGPSSLSTAALASVVSSATGTALAPLLDPNGVPARVIARVGGADGGEAPVQIAPRRQAGEAHAAVGCERRWRMATCVVICVVRASRSTANSVGQRASKRFGILAGEF